MTSPGRYPLRSRTSSAVSAFSMFCSAVFMWPLLPLRANARSFTFFSASAMRRLISACRRALFASSSSASARCCNSMDDEKVAPPRARAASERRKGEARARPVRGQAEARPTLGSGSLPDRGSVITRGAVRIGR